MYWKIILSSSNNMIYEFVGERRMGGIVGIDSIGFWLDNCTMTKPIEKEIKNPVYIPWTSVLYIMEIP